MLLGLKKHVSCDVLESQMWPNVKNRACTALFLTELDVAQREKYDCCDVLESQTMASVKNMTAAMES